MFQGGKRFFFEGRGGGQMVTLYDSKEVKTISDEELERARNYCYAQTLLRLSRGQEAWLYHVTRKCVYIHIASAGFVEFAWRKVYLGMLWDSMTFHEKAEFHFIKDVHPLPLAERTTICHSLIPELLSKPAGSRDRARSCAIRAMQLLSKLGHAVP